MGSWHAWVLVAVVVGCCVVAPVSALSFQLPTKSVYPFLLGETAVNISVYAAPVPTASGAAALHFLNVHQNENTSVVAAKVLLYYYGGSITLLEHGGERLVSFKLEGTVYTFDPNRMFTPVGVEATLKEYGPYSPVAAKHVLAFSQRLLEIYDFNRMPTVVTLHNNGPNYNASLYLPGGPFANEAEKVFIAPGAFARDFFFVTENAFFEKLKAEGLNVVLQQSQRAPTDDGSLSVYAYLKKKPYLNVEAAAADDADGTRVLAQVDMLTRMKTSYTTTSSSSCSSRPVYTTTSSYPGYAARGQQAAAIRTNGPAFLRQNAIREGYLVKQGGIIKNWKRRFWILSGMALYYFVSPASEEPQGVIQLKGASVALNNGTFPSSGQPKYVFAIDTPSRRYYVEADNQLEFDSWVDAIQSAIRGKVTQFYSQPIPDQRPAQVAYAPSAPVGGAWPQQQQQQPAWGAAQASQSGYTPIYPSLSASGQQQLPPQQYQPPPQQPQQYWAQPPPQSGYNGGYAPYGGVVQMSSGYSSNAYPYPAQHQ